MMCKISQKQLIDTLANAVLLGIEALPDGKWYEKDDGISWVWEECTDEEQEKVKKVRIQLFKALEIYKKFLAGLLSADNSVPAGLKRANRSAFPTLEDLRTTISHAFNQCYLLNCNSPNFNLVLNDICHAMSHLSIIARDKLSSELENKRKEKP